MTMWRCAGFCRTSEIRHFSDRSHSPWTARTGAGAFTGLRSRNTPPDDAGILDTATLQTVDDHSPDANSASGGGNTEKLTPMGTGPFKAAGEFIVFRDCSWKEKTMIGG
jgi:hypothetical protein